MVAIDDSTKKYLSEIGKLGGTVCSRRKTEAARKNGRLGGRPRRSKGKASRNTKSGSKKFLVKS